MTQIIPARMARIPREMGYLPGLVAGGFLFVAGQLGRDDDLRVIEEPRAQFLRAWENVKTVLAEAGCTLADVVDVTTFHVRMSETMPIFREVRREVMGAVSPPWTAIGISELSRPGLLVEIKCIARMPGG
jgi:enamine deaminase RidA (YjgF/YER057c/UK114 family)